MTKLGNELLTSLRRIVQEEIRAMWMQISETIDQPKKQVQEGLAEPEACKHLTEVQRVDLVYRYIRRQSPGVVYLAFWPEDPPMTLHDFVTVYVFVVYTWLAPAS